MIVKILIFLQRLLTSGIVFESIPTSISMPPESGPHQCTLSGIPKEVGDLEILGWSQNCTKKKKDFLINEFLFLVGYSTHTLGVKSNCKLKYIKGLPYPQFTVEVVPALTKITVATSLLKSVSFSSLGDPAHVVTNGGLTLYAGET